MECNTSFIPARGLCFLGGSHACEYTSKQRVHNFLCPINDGSKNDQSVFRWQLSDMNTLPIVFMQLFRGCCGLVLSFATWILVSTLFQIFMFQSSGVKWFLVFSISHAKVYQISFLRFSAKGLKEIGKRFCRAVSSTQELGRRRNGVPSRPRDSGGLGGLQVESLYRFSKHIQRNMTDVEAKRFRNVECETFSER